MTDEYKIFVMQASIAGREIETNNKENTLGWYFNETPKWNWVIFDYRIKLPEGWEYVIEDGEIAFREPNQVGDDKYRSETYLDKEYEPCDEKLVKGCMRSIIKRTNK
jgi:hypothetical protein